MANQAVLNREINEEKLILTDAQALNTLFRRHRQPLFNLALGIMGNAEMQKMLCTTVCFLPFAVWDDSRADPDSRHGLRAS